MRGRLEELGLGHIQVVEDDYERLVPGATSPVQIPILHYGMIGTNRFSDYDCCYCLTSYNARTDTLEEMVGEVYTTPDRVPLTINQEALPARRIAGAQRSDHAGYDADALAEPARRILEDGVVIQTVGRVRPFTRPREVITFQNGDLAGVDYDASFANLDEARAYFGLPKRRQLDTAYRTARVGDCRKRGLTQEQTARELGCSVRTVQNYWHTALTDPQPTLIKSLLGFVACSSATPGANVGDSAALSASQGSSAPKEAA